MFQKKKILFHSNASSAKTGFGKFLRNLLFYLYKTNKYEIFEYAAGVVINSPQLKITPWKSFGSIPQNQNELNFLRLPDGTINEPLKRLIGYGSFYIDKTIQDLKPEIYVSIEDCWAITGYTEKKWWNKINCIIHTTLDSLPILPLALEQAKKTPNYFVWAKFAVDAMNQLGYDNVKLLHGGYETKHFYRLSDLDRKQLRVNNNIPLDAFIGGFVFRNQPRKTVDALLQGFKMFTDKNKVNGYLVLHTHHEEGHNISKYIEEFGIDNNKILTTYICRHCKNYEVKPFTTKDTDCRFCGVKANLLTCEIPNIHDERRKGMVTTSPSLGIYEEQLNEIYNLMDYYCSPITSGGQELTIGESKLTELITLVTNYSCGTEYCTPESGGLPLDWTEYREPGSQFIKAQTSPFSIKKQIEKVFYMDKKKKREMEKTARQFTLDNFAIEVIGKQYEEIIDNLPEVNWDYNFSANNNVDYAFQENIESNEEWLENLYEKIFLRSSDPDGRKFWLEKLNSVNK